MSNDITERMFGSREIRHPDLEELLNTLEEGVDYNAPFSTRIVSQQSAAKKVCRYMYKSCA